MRGGEIIFHLAKYFFPFLSEELIGWMREEAEGSDCSPFFANFFFVCLLIFAYFFLLLHVVGDGNVWWKEDVNEREREKEMPCGGEYVIKEGETKSSIFFSREQSRCMWIKNNRKRKRKCNHNVSGKSTYRRVEMKEKWMTTSDFWEVFQSGREKWKKINLSHKIERLNLNLDEFLSGFFQTFYFVNVDVLFFWKMVNKHNYFNETLLTFPHVKYSHKIPHFPHSKTIKNFPVLT